MKLELLNDNSGTLFLFAARTVAPMGSGIAVHNIHANDCLLVGYNKRLKCPGRIPIL